MTREEAIEVVKKNWPDSKYTSLREALEILIPELKESDAESEDERIRKEIIEYLWSISNQTPLVKESLDCRKWIAWLEKQKEQKHPNGCFTCDEYKKGYEEGRRNGFTAGYNKAMKEVEQKEQKPVESISQLSVQGKGVYKICPRCKERMVRDDSMVYTSMPPQYGYECPKCGEMEFDTVMYDNPEIEEQKSVVTHGETYHVDTLGTQQVIAGKMPQKPAEWSEEDEDMLNLIIETLDDNSHYFPFKETKKKMIDWLKSLRPSWKPSDEQMYALEGLISRFRYLWDDDVRKSMESLYNDLKKLM